MPKGYFAFVLHAHLPYVLSHGRWPHGMDWLSEAAAETYLPLINVLDELIDEGLKPKLTIDISPVLCEQLADESFKEEFRSYLKQKIEAAKNDVAEFTKYSEKNMLANAKYWEKFYGDTLTAFEKINGDIIGQFRRIEEAGYLEIMTCGATHGYYPLLSRDESLQVQTKMAVKNHEKHFGKKPRGIWLPECAFRPRYEWKPPVESVAGEKAYLRKGADEFLSENGIDFFIVDSALLKGGKSIGVYVDRFDALKELWGQFESQYQPREVDTEKNAHNVYLVSSAPEGKKPTAIFTRDADTGLLVWSGEHGYPGDGAYLDFHKKRFPGGHRYWAVTSSKADLADKVEYKIEKAQGRIPENAGHFVETIREHLLDNFEKTDDAGILMAPFDAELFGHWWFEGPGFLKQVIKGICLDKDIDPTFLSEHYERTKPTDIISIPEGSWGEGGHHYIWLNKHNAWTWKHIYESEAKMCELAQYYDAKKDSISDDLVRIMKQTARELLLMQASDWQFLISTWSARDYAELRLSEHYADFKRLAEMCDILIEHGELTTGDWEFLGDCCKRDSLFEEIELEWFAKVEFPA